MAFLGPYLMLGSPFPLYLLTCHVSDSLLLWISQTWCSELVGSSGQEPTRLTTSPPIPTQQLPGFVTKSSGLPEKAHWFKTTAATESSRFQWAWRTPGSTSGLGNRSGRVSCAQAMLTLFLEWSVPCVYLCPSLHYRNILVYTQVSKYDHSLAWGSFSWTPPYSYIQLST